MSACTYLSAFGGIVALFFAFDPKAIPGLWHGRIFAILVNHLVWKRNQSSIPASPPSDGPPILFRPLRARSYCSLAEVDFNMHKSNSTFYADLDVSRIELLLVLFKDVITPLSPPKRKWKGLQTTGDHKGTEKEARVQTLKHLTPALGGVSCVFRREIKPWQRYEVETRVLCWDDKWLYIVSHFLKPGSNGTKTTEDRILASAVSKYVFKAGRRTVEPREVLRFLQLLDDDAVADADSNADGANLGANTNIDTDSLGIYHDQRGPWSKAQVERERKRGLALAAHVAGLDGLHRVACLL